MLKINRLYTIPEVIDPVLFKCGLNLILGERDDSSNKTNGVGKSVCIEFINFALLKSAADSRVTKIPKSVFAPEVEICLDVVIKGENLTIKRSPKNAERPTFIVDGREIEFRKLEDATKYLDTKISAGSARPRPSFRLLMGPLIRDERSEFKSIISCYDTGRRIADDYGPHLFLLGVDIEVYVKIRTLINEVDDLARSIKKIKEDVELLRQKDIDDARSDLNELESEVGEISKSIDSLENIAGYEFVKEDIIELEKVLDDLRSRKAILRTKLLRTKPITEALRIDADEIEEFYEKMREGLGSQVRRELQEVQEFKKKIDDFQNDLINKRRSALQKEIRSIDEDIASLDAKYKEKLLVLNQQGGLKNLKQTYAAYQAKLDESGQLKAFISRYDGIEHQKQAAKARKEQEMLTLQSAIQESSEVIRSLEETILEIHSFVQRNRRASLEVRTTSKKQVVEIVMRIDDDGSHSVEREKVFIYDISLLLNSDTSKRHPGFLIHDNIFDVDQDTLAKSLEFLATEAEFTDEKQYILTLNADRLDAVTADEDLLEMLQPAVRATYTKSADKRFLKKKYQELQG